MGSPILANPPAAPVLRSQSSLFDTLMIRNVENNSDEIRMIFDLPRGTKSQDVQVHVQGNFLRVTYDFFSLTLPIHGVDASKIEATLLSDNGVLGVVAPKGDSEMELDEDEKMQVAIQTGW